ncbi:MAG: FAD-binding oxidoreductase [Gammaproteobacteria bacterium]
MATSQETMNPVLSKLTAHVGSEHVLIDEASRRLHSQDIYSRGETIVAVVQPATTEELAACLHDLTAAGHSVIPRGAGMSYTGGYLAVNDDSVVIDMQRMNRVLEINTEDMYVTVQCGCTWQALHEALSDTGLRTPFWGTLSGIHATVGGGLSQNGIFWGSGRFGTALDSVLSLEVVLADGTVVPTGSAARQNGTPFFRHYGPDLTGLFCADTGALGFKATATLKLIDQMPARRYASFDFDSASDLQAAMSELSRRSLPMECFGFDPFLQSQRMQRESLLKDVKSFGNMLKAAGSVGKAVKEGAKVAMAGRRFMDNVHYTLHLVFEERDEASAQSSLEQAQAICREHSAREIDNSIPKILRANPFTPLNNVVGPKGERWGPVHTIIPHSKAGAGIAAVEAVFEKYQALVDEHDIGVGYLYATIANNGFVIEPVFFWPDAINELHEQTVESAILKKLPGFERNTAARDAVGTIRAALVDAFVEMGGVHMQIGKSYRFADAHHTDSYALLERIKAAVDPEHRVNPGSLGLGASQSP